MKKILKLFLLTFIIGLVSQNLYAQTAYKPLGQKIADGVYLIHTKGQDGFGSFDKIFTESKDGNRTVIFNSEGRTIKEVRPYDFDSDGKNEYLISMDCGGSGGFYDVSIIKEDDQGKWSPLWENTFAQPNIEIKNNGGKITIKVEHFEKITDVPEKVTSTFIYLNGKVVKN